MKVLHIVHQFPPETHGGLETYVRDLAYAQLKKGHDVVVLAGNMAPRDTVSITDAPDDGLTIKRIFRNDLFFDDWDKGYCPEVLSLILEEVRTGKYDVVHLHHWIRLTQDLVWQITAAATPVVVTLHDFGTSCPRCFRSPPGAASCDKPLSVSSCLNCVPRHPWQTDSEVAMGIELFRDNFRTELLSANRVLCASQSLADSISGYLDLPDGVPFEILPLGYEPRFTDVARADATGLRIGYWGAVTARKGVDLLIDAFRALTDRHPDRNDVSLHIFGGIDSEELTDKLMSLAEDLNVTFHGRFEYEDLSAAGLNLAVFPSRCRETYGLVLDEAFELGLGVVVPNLGALPDRAGTAGLIFQAEDAASLAECLEQAMDPACRERLQASIPLSGLNAADHADKVIAIYADVLSDSERPRSRPSSVSEQRRADWLALRAENQFRRLME